MATARLIPGSYTLSNTNYLTCNNNNMLANTSNTTYSTITHNRNSNTAYYLYLHNFNFSAIPDNAVVSSFSVKIKAYESGLSSSSSYYMSLYNGTSAISSTTVSGPLTTSTQTFTFPNGSLTWSTLKNYGNNFRIRVPLRRASSNTKGYAYVYGAEIEVTYTAETVHVTGVSLDHNTATIGEGDTYQLTETVTPANATDKSVSWSTSNSSVATVSNGLVTAVSPGSATITVTTTDGGYTDTCAVTVTPATYVDYVLTDTLVEGKEYIIANGSSGSVQVLTNVSGGSGILNGFTATASSSKISITTGNEAKAKFTCALETAGDSTTTLLVDGNSKYLYSDSSNHLRVDSWTSSMASKHWHYKGESKHLLWFFKDSAGNDGYEDTSGTYKYYLEVNGSGNFTDNHVTSPSLADTTTPAIYIYTKDTGQTETLLLKSSGSWGTQVIKVYQKTSGSWVEVPSSSWSTLFDTTTNYRKMN